MQTEYYLTFEQVGIIRRIPLKEQDPDMQGILDAFIQAFRITNERRRIKISGLTVT